MNRSVLKKIAKKYGVTVEEVKRDMTHAIEQTYLNKPEIETSPYYKDSIPTIEEYVDYIAKKVVDDLQT